jgi:hypothetical protein
MSRKTCISTRTYDFQSIITQTLGCYRMSTSHIPIHGNVIHLFSLAYAKKSNTREDTMSRKTRIRYCNGALSTSLSPLPTSRDSTHLRLKCATVCTKTSTARNHTQNWGLILLSPVPYVYASLDLSRSLLSPY